MRVVHVISALGLGGGAEHSLVAMLPALRERGVESSVVTLQARDGGLADDVRAAGFPVTELWGGSLLRRTLRLQRHLRDERPDLVHATLFEACLASRFAGRAAGVPVVNSVVNTSYDPVRVRELRRSGWKDAVVRRVDRVTAQGLVTQVHALTEAVADEVTGVLGVPLRRVTVIPRGRSERLLGEPTPDRRARVRAAMGIATDAPVVITVGRQDASKGQDLLVRAAATLRGEHPDLVVWLVGRQGQATPSIEAAREEAGVGDVVQVLGHRRDVADLLVASDVFAFPSHHEGLGCAVIEAMALRRPVVVSDAPALLEVVDGGTSGVVVPRGDVGALARAIGGLLDDRPRAEQVGSAGRARFEERFDLDIVADRTRAMYDEVLSADGGRQRRRTRS